jgi:hypothetical protein
MKISGIHCYEGMGASVCRIKLHEELENGEASRAIINLHVEKECGNKAFYGAWLGVSKVML